VQRVSEHDLEVEDSTAEEVGNLAHTFHIPVHHLSEVRHSLEDAYLELTSGSVEYHGRQVEHDAITTEGAK